MIDGLELPRGTVTELVQALEARLGMHARYDAPRDTEAVVAAT